MARINTPEKKEAGYAEATNRSTALAPIGSSVVVDCFGYGRWIANIVTPTGVIVNDVLLKEGLAKPYVE